ncbi:MAG TPA: sulfide-dependent adenosine diphosphate thiazole synthase [Nitrospiria bacterium]|nr:sulfide-dependent adenosine diphosphate thiazole synthase [Nitrospiria bacterium]
MNPRKITPLREADITRSIAQEFYKQFDQIIESDVVIIGAGPSGLVCGRELATAGLKVLIIEQNAHLGGGFWSGGYLMTKAAIAAPAHELLVKLGVHCTEVKPGMHIVEAAHACAKLIGAAYDAGVKVLNLTKVVDLIVRKDNKVEGVVVNWAPVENMGHDLVHVDPIALESKIVVDATGHDAVALQYLNKRGLYKTVPGNGAMWVEKSEQLVLDNTGEVYPNVFIVGLSVAAVYGTPRMGPAFGAMLMSGQIGADLIGKKLARS